MRTHSSYLPDRTSLEVSLDEEPEPGKAHREDHIKNLASRMASAHEQFLPIDDVRVERDHVQRWRGLPRDRRSVWLRRAAESRDCKQQSELNSQVVVNMRPADDTNPKEAR